MNVAAPPQGMSVALNGVRFTYPGGNFALDMDCLEIEAGQRIAVVGPSGSGKTTLLNLIAGIAVPEKGAVDLDGTAIHTLTDAERRAFRIRNIGFVFQDFSLLDYLDVLQNILLPFRINPVHTLDGEARANASAIAKDLELDGKLNRPVARLSQGERQRVALCRALVTRPRLLLADEPTGNLDPRTKRHAMEVLFRQQVGSGATLLMVTHDLALLDGFDRVIDFAALGQEKA